MSDPNRPGDVPPDLPPEYVEAYQRGFERAYRQAADENGDEPSASTTEHQPRFPDETGRPPTAVPRGGAHRAGSSRTEKPASPSFDDELSARAPDERPDRPAWLVPALLAGLVFVLLGGAYGVGRVLSENLADAQVTPEKPDGVVIDEDGSTNAQESPSPTPSKDPSERPGRKKYAGRTGTAVIGGASATCESPTGVDSAGNEVGYAPGNVYDQDMTTAWRCEGDGSGQRLTIDLPDTTRIGEVGLVPGYAKTDARSGVDRYAENNRITRVRWQFDDGTSIEQSFDPSPTDRSMQTIRIPVTEASRVVVQILDAERGARNTIAVSELRIGETAS